MTHDTHPAPPHTHTHPTPKLGGCEEDLSNERRGLLHRGHTYIHGDGHRDSMTESAQWADSVKIRKSGGASRSRVCYRWGLTRLVSFIAHLARSHDGDELLL